MADKLPVKIFTAWNLKKIERIWPNIPETNHLGPASAVIRYTKNRYNQVRDGHVY